jgi:hypothetical protein
MRSTTAAIIFAAYPLGAACGGFLNSYVIVGIPDHRDRSFRLNVTDDSGAS